MPEYPSKNKEKEDSKSHALLKMKNEIAIADKYWEDNFKDIWETNVRYAAGDQYEKLQVYEEKIVTNYVHRNNEATLPELINRDIDIIITPRRSQFYEASKRVRGAAYYFWEDEELGIYDRCDEAAKDLVDIGMGVVKTTYLFEDRDVDIEEEVEEDRPIIKQGKKLIKKMKGEDGEPTRKIVKKEKLVLEDRILIETIDPASIRIPFGYDGRNGLRGAPFIAQQREWFHEDFEALVGEENISKFTPVQIKMKKKTPTGSRAGRDFLNSKEAKLYRGWEVWKKNKYAKNGYTVCIVDENFKEYIKEPASSPYSFGQPFKVARDKTERGEFYPKGRTAYYKDNQDEYNMETSMLMSFAKKALPKFGYDNEFITEKDAQRIANGEELSLIGFEGLKGRQLAEVFQQLSNAQIPREILLARSAAREHIDEIPGITNTFAGGGVDEQKRASLGVLQDRGSSRRLTKIQDEIDALVGGVMKNIIIIAQEFLDKDIFVNITGGKGEEMEVVTPNQIKGDYAVTARVRRSVDTQEVINLLTLLNGMPESRQPDLVTGEKLNILKLVKVIIDDSPRLRKIPGIIQVAGDPDDENKRMMKGDIVKPRKGEDHMLHIAKHIEALKEAENKKVDPQIKSILQSHLEETFTLLQSELATQMQGFVGGQDQGQGGETQPIAPRGVASQSSPGGQTDINQGVETLQTNPPAQQ